MLLSNTSYLAKWCILCAKSPHFNLIFFTRRTSRMNCGSPHSSPTRAAPTPFEGRFFCEYYILLSTTLIDPRHNSAQAIPEGWRWSLAKVRSRRDRRK